MTPEEFLNKGKEVIASKSADYTTGGRYENFERQAEIISWFEESIDKAFVAVIAIKLARLASLLGRKTPNNESIEDTFQDLINYCALWGGMRTSEIKVGNTIFTDVPTDIKKGCDAIDKANDFVIGFSGKIAAIELNQGAADYLKRCIQDRVRLEEPDDKTLPFKCSHCKARYSTKYYVNHAMGTNFCSDSCRRNYSNAIPSR